MSKSFFRVIPGINRLKITRSSSTGNYRYCYSVWLRHLYYAKKSGYKGFPSVIVEIGPGDTIGVGLAALITGAKEYYAFDIQENINIEKNLEIFNQLINMFENNEPVPDDHEFPKINPKLPDYNFPFNIIKKNYLVNMLDNKRLEKIRNAIKKINIPGNNDFKIGYFTPFYDVDIIKQNSVDFLLSQAVLEYIEDLDFIYKCMYRWLKPGGYLSHTIDFKSHGTSKFWNGQWLYNNFEWKLINLKKKIRINRYPFSKHLEMLDKYNFHTKTRLTTQCDSIIHNSKFVKNLNITLADIKTSGCFIQATK